MNSPLKNQGHWNLLGVMAAVSIAGASSGASAADGNRFVSRARVSIYSVETDSDRYTQKVAPTSSSCLGDLDGDGSVRTSDLIIMLGKWGACAGCAEDLNGDDYVERDDLDILMSNWGPCPESDAEVYDGSDHGKRKKLLTATSAEFGDAGVEASADEVESCFGDLDGDGAVRVYDLLFILNRYGDECDGCPEDLDGDGYVGKMDMILMTGEWGPCDEEAEPNPKTRFASESVRTQGNRIVFAARPIVTDDGSTQEDADEAAATCSGDLNGDGEVGLQDLLMILSGYGEPCGQCPEDIDGDGKIGLWDLITVIHGWGPCQIEDK